MTQLVPQDDEIILGHRWTAEVVPGGFRLLVPGDEPDILDRAVRFLLSPEVRLQYWSLTFAGYADADREEWHLSH